MDKTLLDYWLVLYTRKWMILLITASAAATALFLSYFIPPVYEAKAVFFVPKEPDSMTFFSSPGGSMIRSPLAPEAREDPHGPYIGVLKSHALAELVQKDFPHKSVGALMRKDTDFLLSDEYLIEVYARDYDPERAAGIANSYVRRFNEIMSGYSLPSQQKSLSVIEEEMVLNEKKLLEAREALRAFQEERKTVSLEQEIKSLIDQKAALEAALDKTRIAYSENTKKIESLKKELEKESSIYSGSELVVRSPLLEKLREQLVEVESKMAALRVELKESHPDMVALQKNYNETKKNIDAEVERIIKSQIKTPDTFYEDLRRQLTGLYIERERLEASTESTKRVIQGVLEKRINEMPELIKRLDTLTMEVERYKKLLETLRLNRDEMLAQGRRDMQVAVLVDAATPPSKPAFPVAWLNMVVAGISGVFGAFFYCFFLDYLEETKGRRLMRLMKAIQATEE